MSKNATVPQPHPDEMTSGFGQRSKPPVPNPALQGNVPPPVAPPVPAPAPAPAPALEAQRTVASEVRKIFKALVVIR